MKALIKYRWIFLLLCLLGLPFLWSGIKKATEVDNRLSIWFLKNDPQLSQYYEFQDKFGNDELLFILVKADSHALEQDFINRIAALTESIEKSNDVENVFSASNLKIPTNKKFGIPQFTELQNEKHTVEDRSNLLKQMGGISSILFNPSFTATALLIQPKQKASYETERSEFINEVKRKSIAQFDESQLHFAGIGVIYEALNQLSEKEFTYYLAIAYGIILVLILIIYRQLSVILYVLAVIILANCYTLGIYGLAGLQLNLMTSLIPIIISLLGVMDIVHIVNQQEQHFKSDATGQKAIKIALKPCVFTSITTMAGFLTLFVSPMPVLRNFGLFAAIGIFFCLLFSLVLAPLFLPYTRAKSKSDIFEKLIPSENFFSPKRQNIILFASILLVIISFIGIFQLQTDSDTLGYFPDKNKVMQDSKAIEESYGAYLPIEFLISAPATDEGLLLKSTIQWTEKVTKEVKGMDKHLGFHTVYENAFRSEYKEKWRQALESDGLVNKGKSQIMKYFPSLYKSFYHQETNTYRLTFFTQMLSAMEMTARLNEISKISEEIFPKEVKISAAGYQPMYASIISFVIKTQVYSLILAFLIVFLLLWWLIKDIKLVILATCINLLPVCVIFGVMGWFSIDVDTATASLAAIILCICIDDTIHFVYHSMNKDRLNEINSINYILKHVGKAIVISSLLLIFGFGSMIFASLMTVFYFGLLITIAVFVALLSQLLLFPTILLKLKKGQK